MSQKHPLFLVVAALTMVIFVGCDASDGPLDAGVIDNPDGDRIDADGDTPPCEGDDCLKKHKRCPGSQNLYQLPDSGICVSCLEDMHCETGYCHPKSYQCVACFSDEHCDWGVCHPDKSFCVECIADDDCESGECDADLQVCVGCGIDTECDDDNECTEDKCENKVCSNTVVDDAPCDGGPCTEPGVCTNGECVAKAIECPCTSDAECELSKGLVAQCAIPYCSDSGACEVETLPDNTACEHGNKCAEFNCSDGQCLLTRKQKDCDDYNVCTVDSCDAEVGCVHTLGVVTCDDGDECTINDSCKGGTCVGEPAKSCDDGDPCTDKDLCADGICAGTTKTNCDDKNPCTDDLCEPGKGCVHLANKAECKGKGVCYTAWQCQEKQCKPTVKLECDDGNPCTLDTCVDEKGCSFTFFDAKCNDDNPCTTDDICVAGQCVGTEFTCAKGVPKDIKPKDGCPDTCVCPVVTQCPSGFSLIDANNDGCDETCVAECKNECDCYDNVALSLSKPCLGASSNDKAAVGSVWVCKQNQCVEECGTPTVVLELCGIIATTPCKSDQNCAKNQFCSKPEGGCGSVIGKCQTVPKNCTTEDAPVCGCDGNTYDNACFATAAAVNVVGQGTCEKTCGSDTVAECGKGLFCELPTDSCNSKSVEGACVVAPAKCPVDDAPVCGCDGKNYGNDCKRRQAMVAKKNNGKCGCEPVTCDPGTQPYDGDDDGCNDGCVACPSLNCAADLSPADTNGDGCEDACKTVICKDKSNCGPGQYCAFALGTCGSENGKCTSEQDACGPESTAMCGCDGKTYTNVCEATKAGVLLKSKGACAVNCSSKTEPVVCGKGLCELPAGVCKTPESIGLCVVVASKKECVSTQKQPVCGCDGNTYNTDCDRIAAKVPKLHDGKCGCLKAIECLAGYIAVDKDNDGCVDDCKPAKCDTADDCEDDSMYCKKSEGACGSTGKCAFVAATTLCKKQLTPVCGCNGKTYDNACYAKEAGANVASKGACQATCGGDKGPCSNDNEFCEIAAGECSDTVLGVCVVKPTGCASKTGSAVCGCDGKTYASDCHRLQAGVAKAVDGACGCKTAKDCAEDWFCRKKYCGKPGHCEPKPVTCLDKQAKVCGCDGKFYESGCVAAQNGQSSDPDNQCVKDTNPATPSSGG